MEILKYFQLFLKLEKQTHLFGRLTNEISWNRFTYVHVAGNGCDDGSMCVVSKIEVVKLGNAILIMFCTFAISYPDMSHIFVATCEHDHQYSLYSELLSSMLGSQTTQFKASRNPESKSKKVKHSKWQRQWWLLRWAWNHILSLWRNQQWEAFPLLLKPHSKLWPVAARRSERTNHLVYSSYSLRICMLAYIKWIHIQWVMV